ncbi:MAG: O-antigen ligase family protein [Anaerolineales bacterium]|jgi:O-antigen ligase/tetratricopeptide (TPR) repeat protein
MKTQLMKRAWLKMAPFIVSMLIISIPMLNTGNSNLHFIRNSVPRLSLILCVWLLFTLVSGSQIHVPRLIIPIGFFLGIRLLSSFYAPIPSVSLDGVLVDVMLVLLYLFVHDSLNRRWRTQTWENSLLALGGISAVVALFFLGAWCVRWWAIDGRFSLPPVAYRAPGNLLQNPNLLAAYMNMLIPIVVLRILRSGRRRRQAGYSLLLLVLLLTLLLTKSRAGSVAGFVGITTSIALYASSQGKQRGSISILERVRKSFSSRTLAAILLLLVVAATITFFITAQAQGSDRSNRDWIRFALFTSAFDIFRQAPFLGTGPGSFTVEALRVGGPSSIHSSSSPHAHNLLLQTAAETGILGTLSLGWIVVTGAAVFIRTWRHADDAKRSKLAAYIGAISAILVHQILDYFFGFPSVTLAFLILVALSLHDDSLAAPKDCLRTLPGTILIIVLAAVSARSFLVAQDSSAYSRGVDAGSQRSWAVAQDLLCGAYDERPEMSIYGFQCGLAVANLAYADQGDADLAPAISWWSEMVDRDPYWPTHWANLAILEWTAGDREAGIAHMRIATSSEPVRLDFALLLGAMEEEMGNQAESLEAYQTALSITPWAQFSYLFESSPIAHQALRECEGTAELAELEELAISGWRALLEGENERAEGMFSMAAALDPGYAPARAGLSEMYMNMRRLTEARYQVEVALFIDYDSAHYHFIAAGIAQRQGHLDEALGHYLVAYRLVEDQSYSNKYYTNAYWRPILPSDLVPQMPRASITFGMLNGLSTLADMLEELGRYEEAQEIRQRVSIEMNWAREGQ